jgi:hypothetical protein
MPIRKVGKDARGRTVSVADCVITKRGQALVIAPTEKALRKRQTARVVTAETEEFTYIRLNRVFRVRHAGSQAKNKSRWRHLHEKYVKPLRKKEARRRRRVAATTKMWPCPVCMNGKQPTRFKIGIQVWSGRRLRVCSTPCKRRVLRGVKELQQAHSDLDPEHVRRQIAYQYMKAGGQKVGDSLC